MISKKELDNLRKNQTTSYNSSLLGVSLRELIMDNLNKISNGVVYDKVYIFTSSLMSYTVDSKLDLRTLPIETGIRLFKKSVNNLITKYHFGMTRIKYLEDLYKESKKLLKLEYHFRDILNKNNNHISTDTCEIFLSKVDIRHQSLDSTYGIIMAVMEGSAEYRYRSKYKLKNRLDLNRSYMERECNMIFNGSYGSGDDDFITDRWQRPIVYPNTTHHTLISMSRAIKAAVGLGTPFVKYGETDNWFSTGRTNMHEKIRAASGMIFKDRIVDDVRCDWVSIEKLDKTINKKVEKREHVKMNNNFNKRKFR